MNGMAFGLGQLEQNARQVMGGSGSEPDEF